MEFAKQTRYIDKGTGEVKLEFESGMGFLFPDDKGYRLFMNKHCVRSFPDVPYPEGLSKMDIANLHLLSRQIVGDSCLVGYRSGGVMKAADEQRMAEVVQLCGKRFRTWLNRMMKIGMIAKIVVDIEKQTYVQYYMSPLYFFSGKHLSLNLYLLFQSQMDSVLPNWAKEKYKEMRG